VACEADPTARDGPEAASNVREHVCGIATGSATLTEILEAAEDAIAAIEDGDAEIAKSRLRAVLALSQGLAH
jgi:hypothetical protein